MKIKIATALVAVLFGTPAFAVEWNFYHHQSAPLFATSRGAKLITEELEKALREGMKRFGTAFEFGAKNRALPTDPEELGKPVAILVGRDCTSSLGSSQALGSALLPVDEHIEQLLAK